jgi:hypothetical protein
MNAYYGKKKVILINMDKNKLVQEIAQAMKTKGFQNVMTFEAVGTYAAYYHVAEQNPDFVLFVDESKECKVRPMRIEGYPSNAPYGFTRRDTEESNDAKPLFRHELRMIGLDPKVIGAKKIEWNDVKDIPWYYRTSAPMLSLETPAAEGLGKAVAEAVADYFIKEQR